MSDDLLASLEPDAIEIVPHVLLLRRFVEPAALRPAVEAVTGAAPLRHMLTPGGQRIGVAMTNCGALGWISDRRGYRYGAQDPEDGRAWPAIPEPFERLAIVAAQAAGYTAFVPDACLVNRYAPGTRMGSHQDRNERDMSQPIVSVSLGLPATFLWYGETRGGRARRIALASGDVLVWGGPARLGFHGVATVRDGEDPVFGRWRYNLTFRRAG